VGNVLEYLRDPLGFLDRLGRDGGDMVRVRLATMDFTVVSHPDVVEEILVTRAKSFHKDKFGQVLRLVLGDGLLTSEGDVWRRQRRLANPAFHKERIAGYAASMVEQTTKTVATWRDGETRDIHKDMMRLTLEIVAKTLFGSEVGEKAEIVGEALEAVLAHFTQAEYFFVPLLRRLPTPGMKRFFAAKTRLDEVIGSFIKERRKTEDDRETPSSDLLSMLLHAEDTDGTRMNDAQLRDEIMTIFLAGHETTAIALTWTWLLLSKHPEIEAKLHASLDEVLGDRVPSFADVQKLTYADAVMREAMRLYPPAWSIGREAMEDMVIGGFSIPKGTQIWLNPWGIHHDPRWYPEPHTFKPERWLDESIKSLPKYAYFPFGGGPRICIGAGFATMEAVLLLATIARTTRLRLKAGHRVAYLPSVTLRPKGGLPMTVQTRRAST
jgi:cytochrome P450